MTEQEKLQLRMALSFLSGRYNAEVYISKQQADILVMGSDLEYSRSDAHRKQLVLTRCEEIVCDLIEKALNNV
jgi:hypothetical protein